MTNEPIDTTPVNQAIDTTHEAELEGMVDDFIATVPEAVVTPTPEIVEESAAPIKKDIPGTNPNVTMRVAIANGETSPPKDDVKIVNMPNTTREERSNENIIPEYMIAQVVSAQAYYNHQLPDKQYAVAPDAIDKNNLEYYKAWAESLATVPENDQQYIAEQSFARQGSDWQQGVYHNNQFMTGVSPRAVEINENTAISGMAAIDAIKAKMGVGIVYQQPLWHSGIHVYITSASNNQLLDLDRQLVEDKIDYGFISRGMMYSSENYQFITRVADFIIGNVKKSNLTPTESPDLRQALMKTLLITDIPLLAAGQAHLLHINGYPYHTVCMTNPESCKDVRDESLLRVNRMIWTDNSRLSSKQKDYMIDKHKPRTEEDMREYQKELFSRIKNNYIELPSNDGTSAIGIKFRVPTIEEYRRECDILVASISAIIEQIPTTDMDDSQRNQLFKEHVDTCSLRKYSAYVDGIVMDTSNREKVIVDRETIRTIMSDVLSLDVANVDRVWLGIKDFMADAYISMVATARVPCSRCGGFNEPEDNKHPLLIPLDALELFFILRDRQLIKGQIS